MSIHRWTETPTWVAPPEARSWAPPADEPPPVRLTDRAVFLLALIGLIALVLAFVVGQELQDRRLREQCQANPTATTCAVTNNTHPTKEHRP